MPKVKATIEYNGNAFEGFQRQKHTTKTITTAIEEALLQLNIDSPINGSGRTDAGVHASNQVIDFIIPRYWNDLKKLKNSLNRLLKDIRFKHIVFINDEFHSRFHAKRRIYRYVFKTTEPSVFEKKFVAYYKDFDLIRLQKALKAFEGEHDFSLVCKSGSQTHTNIRTIYKAYYKKHNNYYCIYFEANGFLRAQVRMMVYLAMAYAQSTIEYQALKEQIDNKKKISSRLAPPQGLYLARIIY
jgi:tRNA pseudouridine38-40 synthase